MHKRGFIWSCQEHFGNFLDLKSTFAAMTAPKIDLTEAFGKESTVKVYLAVPKLQLGRANVAQGTDGDHARYVEAEQQGQDESRGGGLNQAFEKHRTPHTSLGTGRRFRLQQPVNLKLWSHRPQSCNTRGCAGRRDSEPHTGSQS